MAATPFLHDNGVYQFVALVAVAIFGTDLERRFGPLTAVIVFLLAGAGGAALSVGSIRTRRRSAPTAPRSGCSAPGWSTIGWPSAAGSDRGNDLIGVYVFAVVLLLLAVAWPDASIYAAVGGAAIGGADRGPACSPRVQALTAIRAGRALQRGVRS